MEGCDLIILLHFIKSYYIVKILIINILLFFAFIFIHLS